MMRLAQEYRSAPANHNRFFFISSASQDSDMVYDICCEMNARGIPICYDDGLPSDKKTEKHIDARIKDCREVIFFIDNDSPSEQNYQLKYEYVAAQKFRKPVHIITLDDMVHGGDLSPEQVVDVMEGIIDFSEQPLRKQPSGNPQSQSQSQSQSKQTKEEPLPELPAHDKKRGKNGRKVRRAKAEKPEKAAKTEKKDKTEKTKKADKPEKEKMPVRIRLKTAGIAALAVLLTFGAFAVIRFFSGIHRAVVSNLDISASDIPEDKKIYGDPDGDYQAVKDAVNVSLLKYRYDKEIKGVVITGVRNKNIKTISVPEYIKGKKVKDIGEDAFSGCTKLTRIELPEYITSIGSYAFSGCWKLMEINIPRSVTYIGSYAFSDCSDLEKISVPSSVTEIQSGTFYGCRSLAEIVLPNSLQYIGSSAFSDCHSLTEVTIPSSVTGLGYEAFWNCTGLKKITIPSSVDFIESDAFYNCYELTIYGKSGSCAEQCAYENGVNFVAT